MRNRIAVMIVTALSLLVLLAGCQSPSSSCQSSSGSCSSCQSAMMCDRCGTTWAPSYEYNNKGMLMYSSRPEVVCPTCTKTAHECIQTGKMPWETCPSCGGHCSFCKSVACGSLD